MNLVPGSCVKHSVSSNPSRQVFVVDDSRAMRNGLAGLLAQLPGLTLSGESGDAKAAVELLRSNSPDVVILDIDLGAGGSGMDVLHFLARDLPSVTVIVFSSTSDEIFRRACKQAGAHYFFDKGQELESLRTILKTIGSHTLNA